MYTRHPIEVRNSVIECRKNGSSIPELMGLFHLPKTTIWHMVKNVPVPPEKRALVMSRRGGTKRIRLENLEDAEISARMLLAGKYREYASLLAMLYWAEGTKKQCSFVNTDGGMIALYLHLMRTLFDLTNDDMTFTVRTFGNLDKAACLEYWSNITGVQKKRFIVRLNDGGTNSRRPYGMLSVLVLKGHLILKTIQALYRQLQEEILTEHMPS